MGFQQSIIDQTARQVFVAHQDLSAMLVHAIAIQEASNTTLPLVTQASRAMEGYRQFVVECGRNFFNEPTEMAATLANYDRIFRRLLQEIQELCLQLLPQFLQDVYKALNNLLVATRYQAGKGWPASIRMHKQLTGRPLTVVSHMYTRYQLQGALDPVDLVKLTAVFQTIQQARRTVVDLPVFQRKQYLRAKRDGMARLRTLHKKLSETEQALVYIGEHSPQSPDDSYYFARAQNMYTVAQGNLETAIALALPGQTEWEEFEVLLDQFDTLCRDAHALCKVILHKAKKLLLGISKLHGQIKATRSAAHRLHMKLLGHRYIQQSALDLLELVEVRLKRLETNAEHQPPYWPSLDDAFQAVTMLVQYTQLIDQAARARGGYGHRAAALQRLSTLLDFQPIDQVIERLSPPQ